ncbi:hypothetical protein EIN_334800 [Entamoeba invadens IP1]|uniref:Uncharacterized protein n=1 Tax=Entamoeba invadens IP1 TaxID=370355 RepID=L7FLA0_ENTIV|nr:hypothetical protein EIN_334800 [Entamoeba invadens IP1]ELP88538.1 hypothetical protein EIN_334800 [Entamoeba invadens IP1]|eukprot:XP_004255309.1 hypothetical protein EIN_334800 [Entamoeba invadens IP1]
MQPHSYISNVRTEYQYNSKDCTGTPRSVFDWINTAAKVDPQPEHFIAFRGDSGTQCRLDDTIDGEFFTDECASDINWVQWKIYEENGRYFLRKSHNVYNCDPTSTTVYKYNYECNKCDEEGRLTKCYGIGGVKEYTDFTMRGPENTLDIDNKPNQDNSNQNNGEQNEENGSHFVVVLLGLLTLSLIF